jgi:Large ribosomal RNA subunit accumulation protein YceD
MAERKSQNSNPPGPPPAEPPWRLPVRLEDIPEGGEHFDLEADLGVRTAVAKVAGLRDLPRLQASFDVTRRGSDGLHVQGLHVSGSVSASVGQSCVVTLEPIDNEIEESIDLAFVPQQPAEAQSRAQTGAQTGAQTADGMEDKPRPRDLNLNGPEPLIGGAIDLGALAVEFLILGLDPYPRKPGAVFQPPQDDKPDPGPFAALAKLNKDSG